MKIFPIPYLVLLLTAGSYQQSDPFIPSHYDLQLRLITTGNDSAGEQWTAPGRVRIVGVNKVLSNQIVLQALDKVKINENTLAIKSIGNASHGFQVASITRETYEFKINLTSSVQADQELELFIDFVAPIQETCQEHWGICNDEKDSNGAVFSPRIPWTAFPCISEDHLRATFNLTLIRRNEFNSSLSNSPIISQTPDPQHSGWTIDTFAKTQPMETEHFRFMISKYISIENKSKTGLTRPVKVHGPISGSIKDREVWQKLANYATTLMETYDEFYQSFKPIPKFDWVMLPHSNIESRDTLGIYFEEENSLDSVFSDQRLHLSYLQMVRILTFQRTKIILNNVTYTKGENDLDLAFGIREFIKCLGHESVEIEEAHRNILKYKHQTMEVDRNYPNRNPLEHKWATIMRMMQMILTKNTFKKGISQFISLDGDSSISTFYSVMDNVSEQDGVLHGMDVTVKEIVDSWVTKPGYPIVTVSVDNDTHIRLTQKGIVQYEGGGYTSTNSTWNIPMFTVSQTDKVPHIPVMLGESEKLIRHNTSTWILTNYECRGMHRTIYDESILAMIQEQLVSNYTAFDTLARSQLLNDYYYFAVNDFVSYPTTLNLMRYITNETRFEVFDEFAKLMQHLHEKFMFSSHYPIIKNYLSRTLEILWNTAKEQGKDKIFTGDVTSNYYTATTLDVISCQLGENSCVDWTKRHINNWRANNIFENVLKSGGAVINHMLCAIVASGEDSQFQFLLDVFSEQCDESIDTSFKNDICIKLVQSLACTSNITEVNRLLDESWTWKFENPVGVTILLKALASKTHGQDIVLNYIKKNFDKIHQLNKYYSVSEGIEILSHRYSTPEQLKMVQEFISLNEKALLNKKSFTDSVERIKRNIAWMNKQGHEIVTWLNQQK